MIENQSYDQKIKHITLVISSLSCGGAERAVVLIAEGLIKRGHKVSLITISGDEKDFYKVPDGVYRLALNLAKDSPTLIHALWNNLYRCQVLRKAIQSLQPDVVISHLYQTNILTLLSLLKTEYPVIVTEQNDPSMCPNQGLWGKLRRIAYPLAAKVVSVSQGVDIYFEWLSKSKRTVIYNPLQLIKDEKDEISLPPGADLNKKWVIAMGRLDHQKNFELLLSAFHRLVDKHPDWQLLIFGEGVLRPKLEKLVEKLGLTNKVLLPGVTNNPISMFKRSELFVLSSRFEGLPLVLLEALACGLPIVSTDCPSGPREIIQNGIDGVLVPSEDVLALAKAMDYLMSNEGERKRLAENAPEASNCFSFDVITGQWEVILQEVVQL
ncbi:glycosyltransferase family 4 protein [Anabaena sp. UHCC 0451]|uniref:glycosyltransferase family 4 protein n=1 Tax=Anabaena sp. UHCC 0451 TaxID=2055235 RepID=UPI002B2135EE|nr:glycosyltransferase family 4 protein [Anabaena sp. UHCC 0451]MEA5579044.1 glycosyltransferase family 4 protein [Anabaena sp. UHCC 0451]